jgi:hypothetical protein
MEKTNSVSFTVNRQIEIEAGVILSPGAYYGTSKQLGFPRVDEMTWTKPEYTLELVSWNSAALEIDICVARNITLPNS